MADRCAWFTDPKIGRWFSPQCMGGAVYGEHRCTCPTSRRSLTDRVAELECTVAELKTLLASSPEVTRQGENTGGGHDG
jgi:hypothetical protein